MKIILEIKDSLGLGGCSITTTPTLDILSAAVGTPGALTPAGVYALGALNFMRNVSEADEATGTETFKIPRPRRPKAVGLSVPITWVTITLEDNDISHGVRCTSSPTFQTLASTAASGGKISQVHKFALIALSRIYTMAKTPAEQAAP